MAVFCVIAPAKSIGSVAWMTLDEGRILGVVGGEMVEETDLRLVRIGVLVGNGGAMELDEFFLSLMMRAGLASGRPPVPLDLGISSTVPLMWFTGVTGRSP
jgi:hypothetical protein